MSLNAVAGQKIYIGGQLEPETGDMVAGDFTSQTWVEIDGWSQCGAAGDTSALISTDLINRGRTIKQKGTRNAGQMQNVFAIVPNDAGQIALIAAEGTNKNYAFRIDNNDAATARAETVTISVATPGVFTNVAHGFAANTELVLSTSAADLPAGLTAGTVFVKTVLSADTFTVSLTAGGAAIDTSDAGSGTHTVTTVPAPSKRYFVGLVMTAEEAGGEANTVQSLNATIEINSNIVKVDLNPTT